MRETKALETFKESFNGPSLNVDLRLRRHANHRKRRGAHPLRAAPSGRSPSVAPRHANIVDGAERNAARAIVAPAPETLEIAANDQQIAHRRKR
jgi:hypothetical protein